MIINLSDYDPAILASVKISKLYAVTIVRQDNCHCTIGHVGPAMSDPNTNPSILIDFSIANIPFEDSKWKINDINATSIYDYEDDVFMFGSIIVSYESCFVLSKSNKIFHESDKSTFIYSVLMRAVNHYKDTLFNCNLRDTSISKATTENIAKWINTSACSDLIGRINSSYMSDLTNKVSMQPDHLFNNFNLCLKIGK